MSLAKRLRDSGQRASGLYAGWLSPSDRPRPAQADTGFYAVGGSFYRVGTGPFPEFRPDASYIALHTEPEPAAPEVRTEPVVVVTRIGPTLAEEAARPVQGMLF